MARKLALILVALLVCFVSACPKRGEKAVQADPRLEAYRHMAAGEVLLDDGHYDEAMVEFELAAVADPTYSVPLSTLGRVMLERAKTDEERRAAYAKFEQVLDLDPFDAEALRAMTFRYMASNPAKAHEFLDRYAMVNPGEAELIYIKSLFPMTEENVRPALENVDLIRDDRIRYHVQTALSFAAGEPPAGPYPLYVNLMLDLPVAIKKGDVITATGYGMYYGTDAPVKSELARNAAAVGAVRDFMEILFGVQLLNLPYPDKGNGDPGWDDSRAMFASSSSVIYGNVWITTITLFEDYMIKGDYAVMMDLSSGKYICVLNFAQTCGDIKGLDVTSYIPGSGIGYGYIEGGGVEAKLRVKF